MIPSDGACYTATDGNYTGWNKFDYPSLSYIKSLIIENEIAPIFATTGYDDTYKVLDIGFSLGILVSIS